MSSESKAADECVSSLIPYIILDGDGENEHIVIYEVPIGLEAQLASRTINARMAAFELEVDEEPGKIRTKFYSSDKQATAEAIAVRLAQRIQDPSPPGAEECCIM